MLKRNNTKLTIILFIFLVLPCLSFSKDLNENTSKKHIISMIKNDKARDIDFIKKLYDDINVINEMKQYEFEKKENFKKRKQKFIDKINIDKIYLSNIIPLKDITYNPELEQWELALGNYIEWLQKKEYYVSELKDYSKEYYKKRIIITGIKNKNHSTYVGQNAMGVKKEILKLNIKKYCYVINVNDYNNIKSGISNNYRLEIPMPIGKAKNYGNPPPFNYSIAFKLSKKLLNNNEIIGSNYSHDQPTISEPIEKILKEFFLKISPIAFIIYDNEKNIIYYKKFSQKVKHSQGKDDKTSNNNNNLLQISTTDSCWIKAKIDNKTKDFYLRSAVEAGYSESIKLEFQNRAEIILGNAGAVNLKLNGEDYPLNVKSGQPKTLKFSNK